MNQLTEKLRPHVSELSAAAASGDEGAKQVISLYNMHVASPQDPGAPALCEAAFDAWMVDQ